MKNIIKTTAYSAVALSSVAFTSVSVLAANGSTASDPFGRSKVDGIATKLGGEEGITTTILNIINYVFTFLYIIAFVLILWAGFQMLTAAGDDEKVKKGKTIMIQAVIGLVVIFLASQITDLLFSVGSGDTIGKD